MRQVLPQEYDSLTRQHYQDRDIAQQYSNEYAGRWTLKTLPARVVALQERKIISHAIRRIVNRSDSPIQTVIDIPCGTGKLASVLRPFDFRVVAADISLQMMELAECEYRKLPGLAKLVQADACATGFTDHEFDAAVCLRLLHRVPDAIRVAILTELSRISRKHVIVSVGLTNRLQKIRRQVRHLATGISTVPYPVTREALISQFARAGLKPLQWVPVLRALSSEWIVICEKRSS